MFGDGSYRGRIENGAIVLDRPAHLPEGATVTVEVEEAQEMRQGASALLKHAGRIKDLASDASVRVDEFLYGDPRP